MVVNLRSSLMFLDLHKGCGRIQDTILQGEQWPGNRRYSPSTNWLDMWGSKQAILGANNNIKRTEQFRLFLVDVISSTF